MFEHSRKQTPAWTAVFITLAGLVYSVLNALGKAEALCITAGCSLFKDITVYGYSLWWAGVTFFALTLLLSLMGKRSLALVLASLALFADIFLLLFMAFTAPCLPCLVAATLIALLFLTLFKEVNTRSKKTSLLLIIWLFAFCPNMFTTINESIGTWAIYGPEKPDMQVYFSPSCPVCRQTIESLATSPNARIAFHPIAETDHDIVAIHNMDTYIREGASFLVAFKRATLENNSNTPEALPLLRWNLFRNKSHLGTIGVTKIPALITNGIPQTFLSNRPVIANPTENSDKISISGQPSLPTDPIIPNIDTFSGCIPNATLPCNE